MIVLSRGIGWEFATSELLTLTRFLKDSEESTLFIVLQLSSCCLRGFDRRET